MMFKKTYFFGVFMAFALMVNGAFAEDVDSVVDAVLLDQASAETLVASNSSTTMDLPTSSESEENTEEDIEYTHPIMRLMPDKSQLVKLDRNAASVIVGNPNHISVMLDTPDTLVVVPRAPGASHFSVMGEDGSLIMQRHVVVGAAKERYVRIRRSCDTGDRNCQPTSTYFCPDMCHEVTENTQR